ncbi:MAG: GTPase ObgE [Dethiobacteria bacterium]
MFVDQVKIFVKGGRGGNGVVSFRREKFVPRGGPDGGDGGNGGDVVLITTREKTTLVDLSYRPHLHAPHGIHGQGKKRHGKNRPPLYVRVPVGTVVKDEEGSLLADLCREGMKAVVAKGGRGGRGNARFTTSRRRAPDFAEKGEPGEERTLILELKLLADVGLVGFPNAGKSTLLARISAARPKIANFPFTTLVPQLGVVYLGEGRSFVAADLPGIIAGAHRGAGLGHRFLKHIERTGVLLYLIDMAGTDGRDPYEDYCSLKQELALYRAEMQEKPAVIAANKMDLPEAAANLKNFQSRVGDVPLFSLSAVTGAGVKALLEELYKHVQKRVALLPEESYDQGEVIFLPPAQTRELKITVEGEVYLVEGDEVEKAVLRADFNSQEGLRRFQEAMKKLGVERELERMNIQEGDVVRIGEAEFTYFP